MTDKRNDIWNDDDEEDRPKKRSRLRSVLLFFLLLAAVLLVVLAAAWRDGTGLDALRRYFAYGRNEGGNTADYTYDASTSNRFAKLGDTLVILSDTMLTLRDGGNTVWSAPVSMSAPALSAAGDRAVAYDVGGTELYVVSAEGLVYQLTAAETEPFVSASLNGSGELAVTAQRQGYKAAAAVYDAAGGLLYEFKSAKRFLSNAYVTDDGKYLAAVTLGQSGGAFASGVALYALTDEQEPAAEWSAPGMCYDIGSVDGSLALLCGDGLYFSADGREPTASYSYAGSYLREFDLRGGEGYALLLLGRYQSGSVGRLVTVGPDGQELASLNVSDEILSISAAGRYIAVLYADRLAIYTPQLEQYAALNGTDYAREALVSGDGSALLLAAERAVRFLP